MDERKIVDSKRITEEIIGGFIVCYILMSIAVYLINLMVATNSLFGDFAILIILEGIAAFLAWKISIKSAFSKKTISQNDVSTVIRNILIIVIIVCTINALNTFSKINTYIEAKRKYDAYQKAFSSIIGDEKTFDSYLEQLEKNNSLNKKAVAQMRLILSKTETEIYTYYFSTQVCTFAVYILSILLQKKLLLKSAIQ